MATTINSIVRELQSVFTGPADVAARKTGFVRRESKLTGSAFLQTVTFGWLHNPKASLEELAQVAGSVGVAISAQGLDQRFSPRAAKFLEHMLHEAVLRVIGAERWRSHCCNVSRVSRCWTVPRLLYRVCSRKLGPGVVKSRMATRRASRHKCVWIF